MDIIIGFLMAAYILLMPTIASVLLLAGDFKYYKRIYKTLPGRTFYRNIDQVYSHSFGEEDDWFVWFSSTHEDHIGHGFKNAIKFESGEQFKRFIKGKLWTLPI